MSTTEATPPRVPSRLLALVLLAVMALAAAGYAWKGSPQYALKAPEAAPAAPGEDQIIAMVEKLAQRLKDKPDDAEGWSMLGRSYLVLGRVPDAMAAYQQAMKLRPDDPRVLTDYAGALAMAAGQHMTEEAMVLVERALKLDPANLKALSLAGSAAFERQDFAAAAKYWEQLVAAAPPGSDFIPEVQAGIDEARQRAGQPKVAQASPPASAPAAGGTSVAGRVSLAPALQAQASPEDTVFVFARAAEGPRMPLAIVKRQVKDLPFDFVLDDSMAMSPALRLSGAPRVVVGARISKSGNATPQPGDLSGQSESVAPGASGLQIEIRQVVGTP